MSHSKNMKYETNCKNNKRSCFSVWSNIFAQWRQYFPCVFFTFLEAEDSICLMFFFSPTGLFSSPIFLFIFWQQWCTDICKTVNSEKLDKDTNSRDRRGFPTDTKGTGWIQGISGSEVSGSVAAWITRDQPLSNTLVVSLHYRTDPRVLVESSPVAYIIHLNIWKVWCKHLCAYVKMC